MADTLPLPATLQSRTAERVTAKTLSIPWYIWCNVIAVSCSVIGGVWDISWHETVGRDTFWTPAHLLIQLCGILAGFGCGYLILDTTFRKTRPSAPTPFPSGDSAAHSAPSFAPGAPSP